MNRKRFLFAGFGFLFFSLFSGYAEISFENPQINRDSEILFSVRHNLTGTLSYKTLFLADASKEKTVKILTCFPEKIELLRNGKILQIRNRYGTAQYSFGNSKLTWIKQFETFPSDAKCLVQQCVSSDGNWLCYLNKTSAVKSQLVLRNIATSEEIVLDKNAEFSYDRIPAKWSPDGKYLVYEKNSKLYFCDPKAVFKEVEISDEFRKIGNGSVNSIAWANSKNLVYVSGGVIYKISTNELYTRGLYSSVVGAGVVIGRLPLGFDDKKDMFWVNDSLTRVVTVKSDSIISIYKINGTANSPTESIYSKPFPNEEGTSVAYDVFWGMDGKQFLWVEFIGNNGAKKAGIFSFSNELKLLKSIENPGEHKISPDGTKIAFTSAGKLFVCSLRNFSETVGIDDEKIISFAWKGDAALVAGGESTVRTVYISGASSGVAQHFDSDFLFLSSVKSAYWKDGNSHELLALSSEKNNAVYGFDSAKNTWRLSDANSQMFSSSLQNSLYRVFVGKTGNDRFENTVYVRSLRGKGSTTAVFKETTDPSLGKKRVALAFDALDSSEGLASVLAVLSDYGIKATFFMNGEFIRRYPKESAQIAKSGHDCASMYFTVTDLTENNYFYDDEFIRRGLARNEDEFFAATGCELSPVWHAPFYKSNEHIKKSGEASGYRYIEAGRLSFDTFTLEQAANGKFWYLSAAEIISVFAENAEDGMVIPVNLGLSGGTRSDYLYEKLSLLIGALLDEGCEFVLVQSIK